VRDAALKRDIFFVLLNNPRQCPFVPMVDKGLRESKALESAKSKGVKMWTLLGAEGIN
jgi:hypothetical protein